jgi:DNA polymerase III subunit chi
MTEIVFYFHVTDRLRCAARLAAQAYRQERTVRVLTRDAAMTSAFGKLLWTVDPTGFFPHCGVAHRLAAETPIIVDDLLEHEGGADVLINLHCAPPPFFSRFEKMAEIVSDDGEEVQAGRDRWRFYTTRGYPMQKYDMTGRI